MRLLLIILLTPFLCVGQKLFVEDSKLSFYSWAPIEDITAQSNTLEGVVDFETGDFFFRVSINSFTFPSSLMQKHFNEKYMESDQYSLSSFQGHFQDKISIHKHEITTVAAEGLLNIHGVKQKVIIYTDLDIKNDIITFSADFNVLLKDYKIKVPKIVRMNIADTIQVNVSGQLIKK
tara:strand:+ start:125 stop:655 length:531 start_codon:yes stop_codon:yes gene_type:complete